MDNGSLSDGARALSALRRYPGAKAGPGVYQTIISKMPPHRCYIEAFVGGGALLRRKRPAELSIAIDADARVAAAWSALAFYERQQFPNLRVIHGDALELLVPHGELRELLEPSTLVYADPPYLRATRRSAAALYRHEFTTEQHERLAELLATLPCRVILSGYRNAIYDGALRSWQRLDFRARTHAGPSLESVWLNFEPESLHDYSYLGENYRERERIKRKRLRWRARLAAMPALERRAVLAELLALEAPGVDPLAISGGAGDRRAFIAGPGGDRSTSTERAT